LIKEAGRSVDMILKKGEKKKEPKILCGERKRRSKILE